jgi:hypothetical protein
MQLQPLQQPATSFTVSSFSPGRPNCSGLIYSNGGDLVADQSILEMSRLLTIGPTGVCLLRIRIEAPPTPQLQLQLHFVVQEGFTLTAQGSGFRSLLGQPRMRSIAFLSSSLLTNSNLSQMKTRHRISQTGCGM